MQALIIAATVAQVASMAQASSQKQMQYQAAAQANEYNAAVMRQRAEATTASYGQREEQQRRAARIDAGSRRAAMAESGTGLGGSNADIEHQSSVFAELDALNIRYAGQLEAQGLQQQAGLEDYSATMSRKNASATRNQAYIGMAGAILGGAASYTAAGKYGTTGGGAGSTAPRVYGMYGNYNNNYG